MMITLRPADRKIRRGYSFIELLLCVAVAGIMFVTLYWGLAGGFGIIQLARENLRATQILQEKMETIRLYRWDQINTAGFIPTNFTEPFYATTQATGGLIYTGAVTIASAPVTESYSNDMRQVSMTVFWKSGGVLRTRDMSTFVTRYGLQQYIY